MFWAGKAELNLDKYNNYIIRILRITILDIKSFGICYCGIEFGFIDLKFKFKYNEGEFIYYNIITY